MWSDVFEWMLLIAVVSMGAVILFLLVVFIFATAMYIFPAKQIKHDLKQITENEIESRIYLDEYKFTIANQHWQEKIDAKVSTIKELDSKIRKKSAELKSITAAIESKRKATGTIKEK